MKKLIFISMIVITAMGIIGCSNEDKTKADLKWKNGFSAVSDIKWVSNGSVDQSWSGTFNTNDETSYQGITELAGSGECIEGGANSSIIIDTTSGTYTGVSSISSGSAVITENAAALLTIYSAKKK